MRRTEGSQAGSRSARVLLVVALVLVAASCGSDSDGRDGDGPEAVRIRQRAELQRAGEESVALVQTEFSTGTAVLIGDGYLVTNAHIVDPFDEVELRFASGGTGTAAVAGVDLTADLALLGPIETAREPLPTGDPGALTVGDEVSLLSFPEPPDDGADELTVTSGEFRVHNEPAGWDLDYLLTSAHLGDGMDGGALVDADGKLVGIASLVEDGGATALSLSDVDRVVADLRAGTVEGPAGAWVPVPAEQGDTRHVVATTGLDDVQAFFVSGRSYADEIEITVSDPTARVGVFEPGLWGESRNQAAMDAVEEERSIWGFDAGYDGLDLLRPDATGKMVATTNSGQDRIVLVATPEASPDLAVTFSPGAVAFDPDLGAQPLTVGEEAFDAITYFDSMDVYDVALQAGDRVKVEASSATGGVAFLIAEPGEPWGLSASFDPTPAEADNNAVLDTDGYTTYEAPGSGTYQVVVYSGIAGSTSYRLKVESI